MTLAWVDPETLPGGQFVLLWLRLPGDYGLPVPHLMRGIHLGGGRVAVDDFRPSVVVRPRWVLDVAGLPPEPVVSPTWAGLPLPDLSDEELERAARTVLSPHWGGGSDGYLAMFAEMRRRDWSPERMQQIGMMAK